ncbi:hypothetical protein BU15DRAFT_64950 [Melanogaster broomeanus]|nr:hypothetical protein BU15DRAFT_64950 [Melanogaster broomeanus]
MGVWRCHVVEVETAGPVRMGLKILVIHTSMQSYLSPPTHALLTLFGPPQWPTHPISDTDTEAGGPTDWFIDSQRGICLTTSGGSHHLVSSLASRKILAGSWQPSTYERGWQALAGCHGQNGNHIELLRTYKSMTRHRLISQLGTKCHAEKEPQIRLPSTATSVPTPTTNMTPVWVPGFTDKANSGYYDRFGEESRALTSSFIASPPPLTALHGCSDIPYFKFTSQGEILSGPHRSVAGLISPLNAMDPGVEMPSRDELLCTTGVLPECHGAHDEVAVQGNVCLTTHQPVGISRSDTASRLNPSNVASNFYSSFSDPSAALGVGSSSLPTNWQGTFGTEPLQEHRCTIDKVTSPVLRTSAPSTTSSTYESGSHLWNVDQDSRNADHIMTDVPFPASPVTRTNTWLPERTLSNGPLLASSVLPPFPIPSAPDSQPLHVPTNW